MSTCNSRGFVTGFVFAVFFGLSTAQVFIELNSTECGDGEDTMWNMWASWSSIGVCSAACLGDSGEATRARTRICPETVDGCDADQVEVEYYACAGTNGPEDGMYGEWSEWADGSCSALCGNGVQNQVRTRECDSPPPSCGGFNCFGRDSQTRRVGCSAGGCGRLCRINQGPTVLLSRAVPGSFQLCQGGSVIAIPCPSGFGGNFRYGFQNAVRIFRVCFA